MTTRCDNNATQKSITTDVVVAATVDDTVYQTDTVYSIHTTKTTDRMHSMCQSTGAETIKYIMRVLKCV